ncbi:MAG: hypothetical protein K2O06_16285 [Acetatifactor sp.]|nr:hypothetical protein [Acetatifactor sp.]
MLYSLEGIWQADIGDGRVYSVRLPGTLDENQVGGKDRAAGQVHPDGQPGNGAGVMRDEGPIATRFTRKYTFEGRAVFTKRIFWEAPRGKRIFLEVERARCLELLIDGKKVPHFWPPSISTPHVFEVTEVWKGEHEVTLLSDNSYPGLPRENIVYSSAATDETQTNWNGVLGYFRLRTENMVFLDRIRVYPQKGSLTVKASLCAGRSWKGRVMVRSEALEGSGEAEIAVEQGIRQVILEDLALAQSVCRWDEYEGNLYELTAELEEKHPEGQAEEESAEQQAASKTVTFGIRDFGSDEEGRLTLNGRRIFLRSEANCAVFPETGYCPMKVEEWMEILDMYRSYGVNCVRFHSHCPPEAAFTAADRMGMLFQPELSHWNPRDAFESRESDSCYRTELEAILTAFANHPSFVMLTFGNELQASETGHERMRALLARARTLDSTRLYADGSNNHYGGRGCEADSDFYTSSNFYEYPLRGTFANMEGYINHSYPGAMTSYDDTMERLRREYGKPVFGFEVGQFQVLPDFGELEDFRGISDPANLQRIRDRVEESGLGDVWKRYVEASGELARICYREEIEAVLRTGQMSGISLLGLQDFPGQGTALVGMLNSHLRPKPYAFARPEAFREFFAPQRPLVLLEKYTYENTEKLEVRVRMVNYGREEIRGRMRCRLEASDPGNTGAGGEKGPAAGGSEERELTEISCPVGTVTDVGRLEFSLEGFREPARLKLTASLGGFRADCFLWVYPPARPVCPKQVYETEHFDEEARAALRDGGIVYLTPPATKEALPSSIQAQFSTDFWSVGTFAGQEGGMGQLIAMEHPIFRDFPTESHTNWQWWPMASGRAVILPKRYEAIITEMDSYAYLRPMAQLLECRCGGGRLLLSTMGLQNLQMYPEARALLSSIYRYLGSQEFAPGQEIEEEVLERLVP